MISIMFTRSNTLGSYLIRKVTGEDCSHCAILVGGSTVHHSSAVHGVSTMSLRDFRIKNEIVHAVNLDVNPDQLELGLVGTYDYPAIFFLALRYFGKKIGIRTAKVNLWQTTGMYLCTEYVSEEVLGKADSLTTPHQLYETLSLLERNHIHG